jgi:hypothetical protein
MHAYMHHCMHAARSDLTDTSPPHPPPAAYQLLVRADHPCRRRRSVPISILCVCVRACVCIADVVKPEELADLTADDLQLLLSGAGGFIQLETFHEVTKFRDQRGPEMRASDPERLSSFKELVSVAVSSAWMNRSTVVLLPPSAAAASSRSSAASASRPSRSEQPNHGQTPMLRR